MKYTIRFYSKETGKQFAYYVTHKESEADSIMKQKWSRAYTTMVKESNDNENGLQY